MAVSNRKIEVTLADEFLADAKSLFGAPPEFGPKRVGKKGSLWEAIWPIANSIGIVESGQLRIVFTPASDKPFTISLVFRGNSISRIDFVADTICHSNPLFARCFELPPNVCGPHFHSWGHNREHILLNQSWELPCREPLPTRIHRFDQAFPWFAEKVNLTLSPDQRQFCPPRELV